jgi:hypothetical protein
MSYCKCIVAVVCAWFAVATAQAVDHPGDRHDSRTTFLNRIAPVGGCDPDGGGLFHWWDPHCFPRPCGPDDYCRTPFPRFCGRPATLTSMPMSTPPTARLGPRVWAHGN